MMDEKDQDHGGGHANDQQHALRHRAAVGVVVEAVMTCGHCGENVWYQSSPAPSSMTLVQFDIGHCCCTVALLEPLL